MGRRRENLPVGEAGDAFAEVTACLILGVDEDLDVDLGELPGQVVAQVARELVLLAKGRFAALVRGVSRLNAVLGRERQLQNPP